MRLPVKRTLQSLFNAEEKLSFTVRLTVHYGKHLPLPDTYIYTVSAEHKQTKNKPVHFLDFVYLVEFIKTAFSWLNSNGK